MVDAEKLRVGDKVRLREGQRVVDNVGPDEVGEVTWVEPPPPKLGKYCIRVKFPRRELEAFYTDFVRVV